ncbi:MAG: thymidylate synthase ThyX [Spirochaetales bacterium]|nr:thymidylate synthase ThyX [Spirochaetales bacterium]
MKINDFKIKGSWREAANSARTTINMEPGQGEPSATWKRKMLLAEHSPIRQLLVSAKWTALPYWVSVHLVRHKIGIEHWVRTQRSDRTGHDRNSSPQNAKVEHEILASYQAIISISRKRLCRQSAPETRAAWQTLLNEVKKHDQELYKVCVPDCLYRGWCMEYQSCGFHLSPQFHEQLKAYRLQINSSD